ncbi:MAG: flagellar biosynthesis anti-sigma factor FlgM [Pelotomaculum sp.]|nr:flagellar biosynthesis anti-sigma factor FlgM [Pelotomaculum sp.]
MKVNGTGVTDILRAYAGQLKSKKADAGRNAAPVSDSLEISPAAKKMRFYLSALAELPEVRKDLVESLRRRVNEGSYKPDAGRIAAGILEEKALDKKI